MKLLRSMLVAVSIGSLSMPLIAEVHKLTEKEYQKFLDDLIGAIEKGSVGVGGGGGSGGKPGGGQGGNPPAGGNDGDAGNDDQGDGVGEEW